MCYLTNGYSYLVTRLKQLFMHQHRKTSHNCEASLGWPGIVQDYYSLIHSDEGITLETSVFESFSVANLPYRPCG